MSEKEKEYFEKLQRVNNKLRGLKYMFRGVLGLPEVPMREQLKEMAKEMKERNPLRQRQPQEGAQQNGAIGSNVQEKFSGRPRFFNFFQQREEPKEPEIDPITQEAIREKQMQLAEEHKARIAKEEMEEEEKQKALTRKRARENIGIHSA